MAHKQLTRTTIVVSNGRYTLYQIHFIKHNLSNTIHQIPFIKYYLSITMYQITFIKYHLSNTLYEIPFIKYHLSNTIYQIPSIKYHLSNTFYQIPFIKYYLQSKFFFNEWMNESINQLTKCFKNGISAVKNDHKFQIKCCQFWILWINLLCKMAIKQRDTFETAWGCS